jgi:iron complex transport system substrate-binding protein
MRIVSLLPSATEIAFELGLSNDLVGVSCDCDFPPEATSKPMVSSSGLEIERGSTPHEIDARVRHHVSQSEPIYRLDRPLIRSLLPDLILAQDLCRVCAVPSGHVTEALAELGVSADVLSLDPHSLDEVIGGILDVSRVTGVQDRGESLAEGLRSRIVSVRSKTERERPTPTLALEWADPPFSGGHWIPEMVRLAGGRDVLGIERAPSRTCSWAEVAASAPEVVVFMPCGFGLPDSIAQAQALRTIPEFMGTPAASKANVFAVDGSSYFSRPGPRLIDGLETLAWILHPDVFPQPPDNRVRRIEL